MTVVFARLCALVLISNLAMWGQLTRGSLTGTVTDQSGAVVPGVGVKATNTQTGVSRETVTNDAGVFRMPGLEPGTFLVEFTKAGFEASKVGGVEIKTTQEVTLNPQLKVGTATSTVEVVEGAAGVELAKTSATIERTFSGAMISQMPLTSGLRDVNTLAVLAPTATRAPGSTGVSANGQRARNNNFMLDGVDNNDPSVTIANLRVIPEAVSEFQVQTSPYSAEFGRTDFGGDALGHESATRRDLRLLHGELARAGEPREQARGNQSESPLQPESGRRDGGRSGGQEQDVLLRAD